MSRFPHACTAFGVSVALCGLSVLPIAPAVADPINSSTAAPTAPDPTAPEAREDSNWANPLARATDPQQNVDLQITGIDTGGGSDTVGNSSNSSNSATRTYTLRIRNDRPHALSNLSLTLYYRSAATAAEVRVAQLANQGEYLSLIHI